MKPTTRAFTLVELLIVMAIIGILSSVALSSMQRARLKAIDAKIQTQVAAFRQLMELERNEVGHYQNFKNAGAWKVADTPCTAASFGTSQYAAKAAEMCTEIVKMASPGCGTACLYFSNVAIPGLPPSQNNPNTVVSIQAYLPGKTYEAAAAGATRSRWYCLSTLSNSSIADGAAWTESGCQQNP